MPVQKYSISAKILATLWTGNPTDLDGFPDLTSADCIIGADGSLVFRSGSEWHKAIANKHYVIRGVTGLYFVWPRDSFLNTYTRTS